MVIFHSYVNVYQRVPYVGHIVTIICIPYAMFFTTDGSRCCSGGLGPTEGEGEEFLDQRPDLGAAAEGGSGSAGKESHGIPQPMGI